MTTADQARGKAFAISNPYKDFQYKNPFKARVWTYLRHNPTWTYSQYQNAAKDKITKQHCFDEVKQDIQLWGYWDAEAKTIIPKSSMVAKPPSIEKQIQDMTAVKELPPSTPTPVAPPIQVEEVNMANKLALPEVERKKDRLEPEYKRIAEELIISNPTITYEALQANLNWPKFKPSNFSQTKSYLRSIGQIPAESNKRIPSGNTVLCRKNVAQMKYAEIEALTLKTYSLKFGHHGLEGYEFYNVKNKMMKEKRPQAPVAAKPEPVTPSIQPIEVVAPKLLREAIEVIHEVDLSEIPLDVQPAVKRLFAKLFSEKMPKATRAGLIKMVTLSDPPSIEIRKTVMIQ